MPTKTLPEQPSLAHLKNQAQDLQDLALAGDPTVIARLREFHPRAKSVIDGGKLKLSDAQLVIAREYGHPSWPRLKAFVELQGLTGSLKRAIDENDFPAVRRLMTEHPELHRARMGYGDNGPLTWVAECRVPRVPPNDTRLAMARWMIEHGSDMHQGGDGPLMRAALDDMRIPMMELLVELGADVNANWGGYYPIICAPAETLAPQALKWLLDHGADPSTPTSMYGTPLFMLLGTYARNSPAKHTCLEVLADHGVDIPDTPPMAVHRGRIDLLERHVDADPSVLARRYSLAEIYPPDLGFPPEGGMHGTPLDGATLLHLAVDYHEVDIVRWLLDAGAGVDAKAEIDDDGFGGQTALFNTVVNLGRKTDEIARLLLDAGADPNARATLRKQLKDMGDPEKERMREFRDVTPAQFGRLFAEPGFVNEAALTAIVDAGGTA